MLVHSREQPPFGQGRRHLESADGIHVGGYDRDTRPRSAGVAKLESPL